MKVPTSRRQQEILHLIIQTSLSYRSLNFLSAVGHVQGLCPKYLAKLSTKHVVLTPRNWSYPRTGTTLRATDENLLNYFYCTLLIRLFMRALNYWAKSRKQTEKRRRNDGGTSKKKSRMIFQQRNRDRFICEYFYILNLNGAHTKFMAPEVEEASPTIAAAYAILLPSRVEWS